MKCLKMLAKLFTVTFVLLSSTGSSVGEGDWSYHDPNGPSTWSQRYPTCNGSHQSPIDIKHDDTAYDASPINLHLETISAKVLNDGKTVRASFHSNNSRIEDKQYVYRAFEVHFHWGSVNSQGAEHLINGSSSAMEIHIVHYNAGKYANVSVAMTKKDGLAVISVLVEIQSTTNRAIQAIVENMGNLTYNGSEIFIPSLPLASFLPHEPSHFYHYSGSLTTPGCYESVKWFVLKNKILISQRQIDAFRKLYEVSPSVVKRVGLVDNFRPVQPLNRRQVLRSFDDYNQCGKITEYTWGCSQLAGDKCVHYIVAINPCTRPVAVTLSVAVPDIKFNHEQTHVSDVDFQIGHLDFGVRMELHSHPEGSNAGKLHLYLYQVHPWPASSKSLSLELFHQYFKIDGVCKNQTAKCRSHSWNKQWCEKTKIGYGDNDTFFIAYRLVARDICGDSPSVWVEFFHKSSPEDTEDSWTMSFSETFTDGKSIKVNLTGHDSPNRVSGGQTRNRREILESRWSYMDFQAKIRKSNNKVDFLLMLTPKGLSYTVLQSVFIYDTDMCTSGGLSHGSKIAIGVTVALVLAVLIGLTFGCLYCKRKKYFGHRQAFVEVDPQDYNITGDNL